MADGDPEPGDDAATTGDPGTAADADVDPGTDVDADAGGAPAARPYLRDAAATLAVGAVVALATGLVPNQPEVYVVGARYYGHPLYWRIEFAEMGRRSLAPVNLLVDVVVFWVGAVVALPVARRAREWVDERSG